MSDIKTYYRPQTLQQALELLSQEGQSVALLGGGTSLVPQLTEGVDVVIDLQDAGLAGIEHGTGAITLGAMTRLQTIVDDEKVPELLRNGALHEGPNTFRYQATLGGVIASSHWQSELLAALLVLDASVTVETAAGSRTLALDDFLDDAQDYLQRAILSSVTVVDGGRTAHARVARTPKDYPIVSAAARRDEDGRLWLALTGVASRPLLAEPDRLNELDPPADFRGSAAYRREMAQVLSKRVMAELG